MINWRVHIPQEERELGLRHRLLLFVDYVLTQMVEAYYRWDPQRVDPLMSEATEEYLRTDRRESFWMDCCEKADGAETPFPMIMDRMKKWSEESGERELTANLLGRILSDHGGTKCRMDYLGKSVRGWRNVKLRSVQ